VYLLYGSGRLIYIGVAVNGSGIRQEYELASDPLALYRRYLNAQALLFVRRARGIQRACGQAEGRREERGESSSLECAFREIPRKDGRARPAGISTGKSSR
jgi:hypothetical protein